MHLVVSKPAKLRAGDLIVSGGDWSEVHMDRETWNRILFEAHCGDKKAVDDILRPQDYFHFSIDRSVHRPAYDIIFGGRVGRVETDSALATRGRIDQFRFGGTKLAIRPGVTEIPGELHPGDLHLQGPRLRGTKTLGCPDRTAHQVEADKQDQG